MVIETFFDFLEESLGEKGFDCINPRKDIHPCEIVRFRKIKSPIIFQVGLEEEFYDFEDKDLKAFYLNTDYQISERLSMIDARNVSPNKELIRSVFGEVINCIDDVIFPYSNPFDQRVCAAYPVRFRNDYDPQTKGNLLGDLIDYICNNITTNCETYEQVNYPFIQNKTGLLV